jgi:hypothetical protein
MEYCFDFRLCQSGAQWPTHSTLTYLSSRTEKALKQCYNDGSKYIIQKKMFSVEKLKLITGLLLSNPCAIVLFLPNQPQAAGSILSC